MTFALSLIQLDDALIALAGLAAALAAGVFVRRRLARRERPSPTPQTDREVERDIKQLLTELSEMSHNITQQLDARAATLNTLLERADEKIAALRQAQTQTPAPSARSRLDFEDAPQAVSTASDAKVSPPDSRHGDVYRLADQGQSSLQIAQRLGRPSGEIELILALRPPG